MTITVKIDSDSRVKLTEEMLDTLGVKPGDEVEIVQAPSWLTVNRTREDPPRRREIDYSKLGTLHDKIDPNIDPYDIEDLEEVRKHMYVGSPLRD